MAHSSVLTVNSQLQAVLRSWPCAVTRRFQKGEIRLRLKRNLLVSAGINAWTKGSYRSSRSPATRERPFDYGSRPWACKNGARFERRRIMNSHRRGAAIVLAILILNTGP